jgi:hypothetical protein
MRTILTALLLCGAAAMARADIVHLCLDGTYYQLSPAQGKYLVMGNCSGGNWSYREQTDVLLLPVAGHSVAETINRYHNAAGGRAITEQQFAEVAGRAASMTRFMAQIPGRNPPACPPNQPPPCEDLCGMLTPGLCRILRGIPGQAVMVAAQLARAGTGSPANPNGPFRPGTGQPGPYDPGNPNGPQASVAAGGTCRDPNTEFNPWTRLCEPRRPGGPYFVRMALQAAPLRAGVHTVVDKKTGKTLLTFRSEAGTVDLPYAASVPLVEKVPADSCFRYVVMPNDPTYLPYVEPEDIPFHQFVKMLKCTGMAPVDKQGRGWNMKESKAAY